MADVEEEEQQQSGTSTEDEEEELKQMANKIRHYRTTLPNKLKQTLALLLAAQRPIDPSQSAADPNPGEDDGKSSEGTSLAEEDPQTAEKIRLLKQKMHSNVSAMPALEKRVTDCLSRIDKQETYDTVDTNIHPAFKRKRTR